MSDEEPQTVHVLQLRWRVDPQCTSSFEGWYDDEHLADMVAVPGIRAGRRLRRRDDVAYASPTDFSDLVLYEVADLSAFETPDYQALRNAPSPRTIETAAGLGLARGLYRELSSTTATPGGSRLGPAVLHVMMACEPEVEDDFNAWYDDEHIPALAAVDGVLTARRFMQVEAQGTGDEPQPAPYLAIYELEDVSIATSPEFFQAGKRTPWRERLGTRIQAFTQVYEVCLVLGEEG